MEPQPKSIDYGKVVEKQLFRQVMDNVSKCIFGADQAQGKRLKIVVLSTLVAPIDQQKALEQGGDTFLPKPVDAHGLFPVIAAQLDLTWCDEDTIDETTIEVSGSKKGPNGGTQGANDVNPLVLLPVDELRSRLALGQPGKLGKLRQQLEALIAQTAHYSPFATPWLALPRQFDADGIEASLTQSLLAEAAHG